MQAPFISNVSSANVNITNPVKPAGQTDPITKGFKDVLDSLTQSQANSDALIKKLSAGEDVDIHQVMLAYEETDVNFRVAISIRDRLVDAYQQVSRMQV